MDVISITGPNGVGKSTMAATAAPLDSMFVIDTENSWSDFVNQGFAPAIYERRQEALGSENDKLLHSIFSDDVMRWADKSANMDALTWGWFGKVLQKGLRKGHKIETVVIDTIEPIEAAMSSDVESNPRKYGVTRKAYGGKETMGVRPLYDMLIEAIAQTGVERLILVSHLKTPWTKQGKESVPIVGVVTMGGRMQVLRRISNMMLWLDKGTDPSGAPSGIVIKARASRLERNGNGIVRPRRFLPPRLPVCTWEAIEEYRENPADLDNLQPDEQVDQSMIDMLQGVLSDKQMELMLLGSRERLELGEMSPEKRARQLRDTGFSLREIATEMDITVREVRSLL